MKPIYVSLIRPSGDLAGVVQGDRESLRFFLFDDRLRGGKKVVGALHIASGKAGLRESDLALRWSEDESAVALLVRGELWAAFIDGEGVGGYYQEGRRPPSMPDEVLRRFDGDGNEST